jgi:hypothetical protein|tara:strand:+ start:1586 stop:3016 length:1431 start_codon:yes stop_codon:yes gene_type:complete
MKRQLSLRGYQAEPAKFINNKTKTVLAIAPGGGKTEIAIYSMVEYLNANPKSRVLVLTHSTNVLLDNFINRLDGLNVNFKYSTDFDPNCQVHICLPNSEGKITGEYDFLIVDEAHENYLAERVQRIIKNIKPTKQLLLTGTPSKFIAAGGYDICAVAANEISSEWFAKLGIELVVSDYPWMGNYNSDHEVVKGFDFNVDDTKKTLDSIIIKLIDRLKTKFTPEQFNNPSNLTKLKKWAFTYNEIGKTMFVCKTIKQAEVIYSILKGNDVNATISHSECDSENNRIEEFKNNQYDVLVVVNRARLGYSDDSLMNIIDISGTHNPDIIYQMFCRVVRGTPDMQKYYLKVTPSRIENKAITHMSVCAALMLTDKEYLLSYNGKNFRSIVIPVRRDTPTVSTTTRENETPTERADRASIMLPEFTLDVIDLFRDIVHNLDNPVSIYKATTIENVKYDLGQSAKRPTKTFEELLLSAGGYE